MGSTRHNCQACGALVGAYVALAVLLAACAGAQDLLRTEREPGRVGGRLVVALRAEPKSFNPVVAVDNPSLTVIRRLLADLIHVDRETLRTSPALAKNWSVSPDGRRYTLELRRGLRFSDGQPFDADDIVFTFEVYLDEKIAAPHRAFFIVGGEPIAVEKLGSHTVEFRLAEPYAVGERLFDSILVLPRRRLEEAYREGRLPEAWGLSTPPAEIAGLGPFRLTKYVPGVRLEMERNPHYWKIDRKGQRLPYLDRLIFVFVPSEDAQVIRFQTGESHLTDRLSAKNWAVLEREQPRRDYLLMDLGPGLNYNFLFFNLNDLSGDSLAEIGRRQLWFKSLAFRRAVSMAIDREGIVRLVYGGRATPVATHVTPGNKLWINGALQPSQHSPEAARRHLRLAGFTWDGEGNLRDSAGMPVEFSIVTNSSNRERVEIATVIQDDLRRLGIRVHVVPLEFRALLDRLLSSHEYDACILGLGGGDPDPNAAIPVITAKGSRHLWRLQRDGPPADWQEEVDLLMKQQLVAVDPVQRKKLYDRVQELIAEHLPMIFLVSPNILAGAAGDLGNFRPAILDHHTLWNVDELFWRHEAEP